MAFEPSSESGTTPTSSSSFVLPSSIGTGAASLAESPSSEVDPELDLDDLSTTSESTSSSESDAEREWHESLQQLELLLSMVVVPYVGKYVGRKCAYWGWARFMQWKYPVKVQFSSPGAFKAAGAVEAAASL